MPWYGRTDHPAGRDRGTGFSRPDPRDRPVMADRDFTAIGQSQLEPLSLTRFASVGADVEARLLFS